jgi:serine/threonine protein phosphatase 1
MRLGEARVPEGLRLYAIGDVHGCDDLLAAIHARIAEDLTARPAEDHRIIHVGDYVDRGPATAAVVERLSLLSHADERVLCLRGNHEEMLLAFLADPIEAGPTFLANRGAATLASYGVSGRPGYFFERDIAALADALASRLPAAHRAFLQGLPYFARFGDFFFCHAGIRPGVAIENQDRFDLTWIREGFLDSDADFGVVVVHGHTPAPEPEIMGNRINIDTGAVFSGRLTCVVLEGSRYRFL